MPMFLIEENMLDTELNTNTKIISNHWKLLTKFTSWFYAQEGRLLGNYSRKYKTFSQKRYEM